MSAKDSRAALGVMHSLVAMWFVLIYKTSAVLHFARRAMLLFVALTFASLVERGASFAFALVAMLLDRLLFCLSLEEDHIW